MFVNNIWCNLGLITVKEQLCTKDIELITVSLTPYHPPREFSHAIVIVVYVPPSASTEAESEIIHAVSSGLQT